LELISAAVQFPLMESPEEFVPHPANTKAMPSTRIVQICFIRPPTLLKDELPLGNGMNPEAMDLGLPDGGRETQWASTLAGHSSCAGFGFSF
jgi:hypothetical protein